MQGFFGKSAFCKKNYNFIKKLLTYFKYLSKIISNNKNK